MGGTGLRGSDLGMLISLALALLAIRLFRTAWHTRKAPELLAGLFLITVPPAVSLVMRLDRFGDGRYAVETFAYFGLALGGASLSLFTWRAFRPESAWARWLAVGLALLIMAGWVGGMVGGSHQEIARNVWMRLPGWISSIWLFLESFHHFLLMRRRLRLGLADPVVANRFLLFSIWTGSSVLLPLATVVLMLATGNAIDLRDSPLYRGLVRVNGLVMMGGIWLSFFPPHAYQSWLRARHATGAGAAALPPPPLSVGPSRRG